MKYDADQVAAGAPSGFVAWTPFDHPQLGAVEIGGFVPGFKRNPPEAELPRLVGEQAKFVEGLMGKLPSLRVDQAVEAAGPGLWRITVRVTNDGSLPTMAAIGVKARRALPMIVAIDVPLERIVAGNKINRTWAIPGSGGSSESQWLVRGESGSTVGVNIRPTVGAKSVIQVKLQEVAR